MIISKKMCLLVAGFISICSSSFAQKKKFTIAEATNGMSTTLALKNIKQPSWQPGSNNFYQVVKDGRNDYLIKMNFPSGNTDTIENLPSLNKNLFGKDSLKGLPVFNWIDNDYAYFNSGNTLYRGILAGKNFRWNKWLSLPKNAAHLTVHKSMKLAFTVENNLWFATHEGQLIQVTTDADKNILNGQSVHRNEFGIENGIFFSPRGNYLAYYRMDQTMVSDYPVVNWNRTPATVDLVKYPMAGGTSHEVTLRVFDMETKKTIEIATGEPRDQYLTAVTWSPDEKHVYIALLNRDQNHLQLNQYDAKTGKKVKTLFEESSKTYVEPQHPLEFLPNRNDQFVWWSQKDGYMHLYLFSTSGKQLRQLTKGNYDVNEILGFNEKQSEIIITAAKESPLEKHVYVVSWIDGSMRRIDKEPGVHNAIASEDGNFIFDSYSAAGTPRVSLVRSTQNSFSKVLVEAQNTLAEYEHPEVKNVNLKANDGTPLYGKLILPTDFDARRKYPVIVYLYNGPHAQLVKNSFPESGNLWYEYLAQRGYIVFTMDGRGSANRGRKFEQATFRKLGTIEMEDQLKGVEYLKSLSFVDAKRMGVHGWSYGGFMTTSLMLLHPNVFKVGVAGGPVMDWSMYEVMYTERYMDTPENNPKGYANSNLLTKVGNLRGKLLLIHGTDDATVVWQHSMNFLKKAVDEQVQVDYFVYPGHEHNVRGKDRVHLMQKITDYFDAHLR
ncbi:MAG TPA: DPP IV N-terminal domain-containing protein [Flavipsychrobacter sp.]|nr:DPP IV N-terminal domain-containing protein [Flavipsychrobacter sp.]